VTAHLLTVTDAAYFADPCSVPSLSQSIANILISQSPMHAYAAHPKLGNIPRKPTDATDEGTLLHALLLGKGMEKIDIIDHDDYRTNKAKEARDNALAQGLIPIKRKDFDGIQSALTQIQANIKAAGVSLVGMNEVAFEWEESGADGPVICRGKMDVVRPELGEIIEVKKTRNANPESLRRHFTEYGYQIQHAAYVSCIKKLVPELAGRVRFQLVFIELDPPYAVTIAEPSGAMRELGQRQWDRAVRTWERCLKTNVWPGYGGQVVRLEPMPWMLSETVGDGL
jgi:hypothetical protein